jgi:mannose-1-phosphate guanylyltransferase/phosphomannomutase
MRVLVEQGRDKNIELIDGVKLYTQNGWVLVLPDPVEPLIHLYADGVSAIETEQLIEEYTTVIRSMASGQPEVALA